MCTKETYIDWNEWYKMQIEIQLLLFDANSKKDISIGVNLPALGIFLSGALGFIFAKNIYVVCAIIILIFFLVLTVLSGLKNAKKHERELNFLTTIKIILDYIGRKYGKECRIG